MSSTADGADTPLSPELLTLARRVLVPQELRAAVGDAATPPPAPGGLWRATHGSTALVGLLIAVRTDEERLPDVLFCPVTFDVSDPSAPAVDIAPPVLGGAPAQLWPAMARWLPTAVLDHVLDDGPVLLATAGRLDKAARAAADTSSSAASFLDTVDMFSGAAQALAQIADDTDVLASSPRLYVRAGSRTAEAPSVSLLEALRGSGADKIRSLKDILGISDADALAVLRGRRPLDPAENARLQTHLDLDAEDLEHDGFPVALVEELELPRWRRPLLHAVPTADINAARAAAAAGVYGLAARDSAASPNWAERVKRYLQAGE